MLIRITFPYRRSACACAARAVAIWGIQRYRIGMSDPTQDARTMTLSTEQRQALEVLAAAGLNGATQALLSVHGFDASLIAGLVEKGFATLTSSKARASGKMIAVRITQAGRDALAES